MILIGNQMVYSWNSGMISLAFCPNPNNFPHLQAREIIRIWTKRKWNYSRISLVTIWLHILIKALKLRQLRVKLVSRVLKKSSDSLFPGERRLIWLQYSEMLSISLRFHCPSPDMFCTAFSHAKHPRSARGNFIPILKITRDELPME